MLGFGIFFVGFARDLGGTEKEIGTYQLVIPFKKQSLIQVGFCGRQLILQTADYLKISTAEQSKGSLSFSQENHRRHKVKYFYYETNLRLFREFLRLAGLHVVYYKFQLSYFAKELWESKTNKQF